MQEMLKNAYLEEESNDSEDYLPDYYSDSPSIHNSDEEGYFDSKIYYF